MRAIVTRARTCNDDTSAKSRLQTRGDVPRYQGSAHRVGGQPPRIARTPCLARRWAAKTEVGLDILQNVTDQLGLAWKIKRGRCTLEEMRNERAADLLLR